ncbi:Cytochrome P450 [Arachis hypogaea]|nr:Cytochrome P450 [Arachis hypogaea]
MCPGISLALPLAYVTLASMLQCFEWKLVNGGDDGIVDMERRLGLLFQGSPCYLCPSA